MIRVFLKSALARCGLEIRRKRNEAIDVYRRRGVKIMRYAADRGITVLLDVGANEGQYAEGLRAVGFGNRIVSFEPVAATFAELKRRTDGAANWEARQIALGDSDGKTTIQIGGNSECSSLLSTNERHVQAYPPSAVCGQESIEVRRLDTIRREILKTTDRVFLKLDIQGYELKALRGALETLPQVEMIDIELSLVPLYDGQPLLIEMLQFLEENGFVPVSLENAFIDGRNEHALQIDAIFLRQES